MTEHAQEVSLGKRFEFGANWTRFLALANEDRIRLAEHSLRGLLEVETLQGKTFLDIGSGSGLFSLAARRLGAKVRSLDYDPQSVAFTRELKWRCFPDDPEWTIELGPVLDQAFLVRLGNSPSLRACVRVLSWCGARLLGGRPVLRPGDSPSRPQLPPPLPLSPASREKVPDCPTRASEGEGGGVLAPRQRGKGGVRLLSEA